MKIVVNDIAVKSDSGGVFSILQDLYNAAVLDIENEWVFILGSKLFSETENVSIIVKQDLQKNYFKRVWFDFFTGAKFIAKLKPDFLISMQNTAVSRIKVPQYVYVHTPLPFMKNKKFSFFKSNERKLAFYQKIVGAIIKISLKINLNIHIIVQTAWLGQELINEKLVAKRNVIVLPPSLAEISDYRGSDKKLNTDGIDYIFPSTPLVYKRHDVVAKAFVKSKINKIGKKLCFTITTEDYTRLYGHDEMVIKNPNILFMGRMERKWVLQVLSSGATLVFPSQMETFGLPIIEAKKLQTNIIVNDIQVLRQAVGNYDHVVFFDGINELQNIFDKVASNKTVFHKTSFHDDSCLERYNGGFQEFIERKLV